MAPAKAVIGSPNMEYSSQIGVMRQKAMDEKLEFDCILQYYRKRLLHLHTSCPDMPPHLQQYRAEHQTWSSFWPEKPFPGIEPIVPAPVAPLVATAPLLTSTLSVSGDLEPSKTTPDMPASLISSGTTNASTGSPCPTARAPKGPKALLYPQASASGQKIKHKNKGQEEVGAKAVPPSVGQVQRCGACFQLGHELCDCTRRVDSSGFLNGCPRCNTTHHSFDQCGGNKRPSLPSYAFDLMVVRRIGKPPIRSSIDFRFLDPAKFASLERFPQTCQFAAARHRNKVRQEVHKQVHDPSWAKPESVGSQIHPMEAKYQRERTAKIDQTPGTLASTAANTMTENWAPETYPAPAEGTSTFPGPAFEYQQVADPQSYTAYSTMDAGYQGQFFDGPPDYSAAEYPQHQSVNDTIPSNVSQDTGSSPLPPPPYTPSAWSEFPPQDPYVGYPPQHLPTPTHHGQYSFSGYAPAETAPEIQSRFPNEGKYAFGPSKPCENCGTITHHWSSCPKPCSSCDGDSHWAPECPFSSSTLHVPSYK
ncbi:hypothetical protein V8E51_004114 [Hyaloscypha variabilis]